MKYLCYYDTIKHKDEERDYSLAAINKIDYIVSSFNKNGIKMELISASRCIKKNTKGFNRVESIFTGNTLRLFKSTGGNKTIRLVDKIFHTLRFFFWNLKNIKKGETIICYHSLNFLKIVKLLKKIKKFKLILEVEEIYSDVSNNKKSRNKELKYMQLADKYIFITDILNKEINVDNKPYIVCHGIYNIANNMSKLHFDDKKIHCVYAGTFDPRKGGALAAATAATHLPSNYHIHILGFGSKDQVENMKNIIEKIDKTSKATVTYDGLLSGEEYIQFIQKCDIGLSTQNPNGTFNATSFPSKILSYMSNGLRVVSIRIPAIETSDIGNYIYYYDEQTPEKIAEAIKNIDFNDRYDGRKVLKELDKKFAINLNNLIEENNKE